jgi:hypothetical protein
LGPYLKRIEEIVAGDESAPPKQRHTAKRIFERLREEFGYEGGESQVRAYVAEVKARPKEAFVPLVSVPGEAEADFGESVVEIAGRRVKAHGFVIVLPFSGVWFTAAYPAENAESFADGHARAFKFFGGVPRRTVYDNASYAVKRGSGRLKGRERLLTDSFSELQSVYLFEAEFAGSGKGNEKGSVAGTETRPASGRLTSLTKASSPVPIAAAPSLRRGTRANTFTTTAREKGANAPAKSASEKRLSQPKSQTFFGACISKRRFWKCSVARCKRVLRKSEPFTTISERRWKMKLRVWKAS